MKATRIFSAIFAISSAFVAVTSCGEKDPDEPTAKQYYHSYGGQISEISTVYVEESHFNDSNVQIVVPTPDDYLTFEYPLYSYNNKSFDLTKADPNFSDESYNGWGYCVYSDHETFYWAQGPFADSGVVLCRASRGVGFSAIVNGKFKKDGVEVDINLDLSGADSRPGYSGKVVDTKPEKNFVAVTVDEVYQDKLTAYYVADESEKTATVFVKIADKSYVVFEYDLEDYNGVVYDLSKSDSKAGENQLRYTIAYNSTLEYEDGFDRYLFDGEDIENKCYSGTCKPNLTIENGKANFSVELHAKISYGRCVDLVYDGPAELIATRPLPEPSADKIHRIANIK